MNKYRERLDTCINLEIICSQSGYDSLSDIDIESAFNRGSFDYCNNWKLAGELLEKHGIDFDSKGSYKEGKYRASPNMSLFDEIGEGFVVECNKPCRAIAECYLLMKDEEKQ